MKVPLLLTDWPLRLSPLVSHNVGLELTTVGRAVQGDRPLARWTIVGSSVGRFIRSVSAPTQREAASQQRERLLWVSFFDLLLSVQFKPLTAQAVEDRGIRVSGGQGAGEEFRHGASRPG